MPNWDPYDEKVVRTCSSWSKQRQIGCRNRTGQFRSPEEQVTVSLDHMTIFAILGDTRERSICRRLNGRRTLRLCKDGVIMLATFFAGEGIIYEYAKPDIRELAAQRILLLDGAMGTMIQRLGLEEADFAANVLPITRTACRATTTCSA